MPVDHTEEIVPEEERVRSGVALQPIHSFRQAPLRIALVEPLEEVAKVAKRVGLSGVPSDKWIVDRPVVAEIDDLPGSLFGERMRVLLGNSADRGTPGVKEEDPHVPQDIDLRIGPEREDTADDLKPSIGHVDRTPSMGMIVRSSGRIPLVKRVHPSGHPGERSD